jgi:hypothetical protein
MDVSRAYRWRIGAYWDVSELSGYSDTPAGVSGAYHTRIAPVSDTYPIRDTWVMGRIWVTQHIIDIMGQACGSHPKPVPARPYPFDLRAGRVAVGSGGSE